MPGRHHRFGGATAELEILRGDLAEILVSRSQPNTEYRFGDRIASIREEADGVTVGFDNAPDERFDLVVAADGIGSSTRQLVFGNEADIRSLGLEITYATIPRTAADDDWWRWYNAPGGRSITLRPDSQGTIRAALNLITDKNRQDVGADRRTPAQQRARLRAQFGDAGWEAQRILAGIDDADDLYFESIGQVHAPRWSSGRVALLGDAAYCASPVSGMGTSLALTGAYVLAGELAAHRHHRDAFAGYERIMRPYVAQAQQLPPGTPRAANPQSRLGIAAFGVALKVAATPFIGRLGDRFFTLPQTRSTCRTTATWGLTTADDTTTAVGHQKVTRRRRTSAAGAATAGTAPRVRCTHSGGGSGSSIRAVP
ncbi:FAD-dependent monooxygenase [Arthrobacter ulcerisalmonis]|uniref:FAD-dependent monooxygenase n=1 Tax=Arthrobacter ulcerisalmonis TaxID=2483813 RepID=UPI00363F1CF4